MSEILYYTVFEDDIAYMIENYNDLTSEQKETAETKGLTIEYIQSKKPFIKKSEREQLILFCRCAICTKEELGMTRSATLSPLVI